MNTTVIFSYAFMYTVLFVVVPVVAVVFVMTCIKFFKSEQPVQQQLHEVALKSEMFDQESFNFFKSLKGVVRGKYDVVCKVPIDTVFDIDEHEDNRIAHCRLDYVLLDHQSSKVKMVIGEPGNETNSSLRKLFKRFNIKFIEMNPHQEWDSGSLKQALSI